MGPDQAVEIIRRVLIEALILSAPILLAACITSVLVSLLQTLTGIQEQTLTAVPRLLVVFCTTMVCLPWMMHRLVAFSHQLFDDFHRYIS